jgi:hypothetical protein
MKTKLQTELAEIRHKSQIKIWNRQIKDLWAGLDELKMNIEILKLTT